MIRTVVFLLGAAALTATSFWVYLRAELPVGGTRRLALLRSAALILLLAAVLDVHLPWGGAARSRPRWVLLDASLSMTAGDGEAWRQASRRAEELASEGWTVVRFGDGVMMDDDRSSGNAATDSALAPSAVRTALAPALTRAAEAGVGEVRVLSDERFDDPVEAASALQALSVPASFESFGSDVPNAGVAAFTVSDQLEAGDPVQAELEIFSEGPADSVNVEIREEGRLVLARSVPAPTPGLRSRIALELPAARGEGRQRYTARVHAAGDAWSPDDVGVAYMNAGHETGGLVVVSLRPDWEPRELLAVLAEATGLPGTGYLRVAPDRFVPMGRAFQRGTTVDSIRVSRAARDAGLLVVHGLDAGTDGWGRGMTRANARALLWPLDPRGADALGVRTGPVRDGEWYAMAAAQASPLAADLAGAPLTELPPLTGLLPLSSEPSSAVPLLVQLGGTGPGEPAMVLDRSAGRRRAIVLARGFWRWGARDGSGRDVYRRLWSGVAGWLLASDPATLTAEVRPDRFVVPRGSTVRWHVPGAPGDSVRLELSDSTGVLADTVLVAGASRGFGTLPPGSYRYAALAAGDTVGSGRFDVEARTDELLPRPSRPEAPTRERAAGLMGEGGGSPLRTSPWVYLVILVLLSAEWIGRRRAGLR